LGGREDKGEREAEGLERIGGLRPRAKAEIGGKPRAKRLVGREEKAGRRWGLKG
jgi:hypothetical protein